MCFSASASFGAGVVLTAIGVASIKKVHHPSQLLFATIPLIFGTQQIAEGVLWVTLPNPNDVIAQRIATYFFLFFAQILWPMWVPMAILMLEKNKIRKKILKGLVAVGLIVGLYQTYYLVTFHVEAKIVGHHIKYLQDHLFYFGNYGIIFYALATIVPPFFSHIKRMWLLGVITLVSYLVTAIFYKHYVLSVWCFFSSIISLSIYAIMAEILNTHHSQKSKQN